MSNQGPFAREDVVEAYLDSLLKEPDDPADVTARTAKLLEQAVQTLAEEATIDEAPTTEQAVVEEAIIEAVSSSTGKDVEETTQYEKSDYNEIDNETAESVDASSEEGQSVVKGLLVDSLENNFQALFFEVAGLTLAVPLTTLGGIHQIEKIGPLFGKPDWFMGVMIHREEKLSVVDSARWVMPEKYDESLAESLNYRYLIMLGDSSWGLASEKLVNTVTLAKADVKWRESTGKRPWLAGMVKEKMCALIDVNELISMLNKGLGSNDQTPSIGSQVHERRKNEQ
ncbi:chemotaxis protein CheW [Alteromonas stellipolaris]|uniref:chemotaxis protein CheW n=1 Tax=Alteromonas stellipolaris TaxID=233316 RepID=UPI0021193AAB|nr:chemotaxis protein CheW [Alteromonas stellipolaris]MCQ8849566.1 chemotaxis protein CheW [Alteromonas stellipolaris]